MKTRNRIPAAGVIVWCAFSSTGCSSVMSHTGADQGYYPGTRANTEILKDDNTRWPIKTLAVVDYPFSAVMDTLLLPWDYFREDTGKSGTSLRARVAESERLAKTRESLPASSTATIQNRPQ
ncbi:MULTISPECIES: YceK/YidQ family lipoprotein [Tatumella]|uniref:YceK/YidQ family lipoprotein n=1 Tax=Tatumella punctata TaxID=399969 RepID=A0ABW1VK44_9GAMM|nr:MULTISPECIES: YceK/YidQ family lipoprotein [unclassified Tatumella]MBS0855629.1 YceK/YidQ family lipoprotein [Tatumella sp. JGM16]MBS0876610.1 YceK/YidQ family lipoprotein [Tatumella sp. JGM82]MBS0890003.1 YceK/YidQ family lipoprotein [Tatumella sp. JGM94]MBS0893134.1 YceK/YidQ family lipoprotein [Tatumella sp. JGM130]MBS0901247.1 YceK/YidQ family lipoprotein [Tatumella sp. JGM100]